MIRVYFDWNIFTYLKHKAEKDELFKTIESIINSNKDNLIFPYSPAHLQDLMRGLTNSEKSINLTYNDLEFLQEISQGHCLFENNKENRVTPSIINCTKYFNQIIENKESEKLDIDTLFKCENGETIDLFQKYIDLLKTIPSGIDFKQLDNISRKHTVLRDIFPKTRVEDNFYNLLKDLLEVNSQKEKQTEIYKYVRNGSIEEMGIETNSKNWGNNPIEYLDKLIRKKKNNQTFNEMIEHNLKVRHKDKKLYRFDYFAEYYISLDTFGYCRDKALPNLISDAVHSYYGAYCDVFVTNDDNTYNKAKAVYKHLNVGTKVCKASEFPNIFYSMIQLGSNNLRESVLNRIIKIIRESPILLKSFDDKLNSESVVYEINRPIVDYFNRMQISFLNNCTIIYIYKKKDNFSDFMFFIEIKSIVDKIVSDFSFDNHLKYEFNEINQCENNYWQGRIWKREGVTIDIIYNDEPFGLTLRLRINKNESSII